MIIFENTLTGILPAFNNQVIKFKSDNVLQQVKATILINGSEFIIYTLPDGWFRFNFKEIAKTLVNQNNFVDTISPNILTDGYIYADNTGSYIGNAIITIFFIDGSTEFINISLSFLSSVYKLEEFKKIDGLPSNNFFLLPLIKGTNDRYFIKYFEGYPFDVAYYSTDNEFSLTNNLISYSFSGLSLITRLFFSDGSTDETINNVLPISNGLNTIELNEVQEKYIIVDKVPMCNNDGIYIKWFNSKGGYSYWLFNKFYEKTTNMKNTGELENDFYNLDETTSPLIQIGREGYDTINVRTDLLTENEFNLLSDVFFSPKIYYFTGKPFARASEQDWIEVELKTSNSIIRNWKDQPKEINLSFELPKHYSQNL